MLYDCRDFGLLRLAGIYQWPPAAPSKKLSALKTLRREAEPLPTLELVSYARSDEYLMPSPQDYEFSSGIDQTCQSPTRRPYVQSPVPRRRLEVGTILLTCTGAGIEPVFGKVEHLKRQSAFFLAFALRNAGGNLMNAASCAGLGCWGFTAYMTLYVSTQNTGFVMTNELGHLHNLASVFSETLDMPQALILAGESYQSVYEVLTKKTLSKRHGKKGFVDYSEAYQKLSTPTYIVSYDNTGMTQLAVMRQIDYRVRVAQAVFGARWGSKDDGIPEVDGHMDGNPLAIAMDMDLHRLDRVCTTAVRQGRKEIMVAVLEGQMSGLLFPILSENASVRSLRINVQVLSVALGGDCKAGDLWPDAPLTLKGGFVHAQALKKAGKAGRSHCRMLGKKAGPVLKQA